MQRHVCMRKREYCCRTYPDRPTDWQMYSRFTYTHTAMGSIEGDECIEKGAQERKNNNNTTDDVDIDDNKKKYTDTNTHVPIKIRRNNGLKTAKQIYSHLFVELFQTRHFI